MPWNAFAKAKFTISKVRCLVNSNKKRSKENVCLGEWSRALPQPHRCLHSMLSKMNEGSMSTKDLALHCAKVSKFIHK